MPVAKLSLEFYERFGDKAVDELVACLNSIEASYRSELKDLFDAQFRRLETLFQGRLGATTAALEQPLASLDKRLTAMKTDLEPSLDATKTDLQLEIRQVKADLIRWTSGFWVLVMLAVIGLYFKT